MKYTIAHFKINNTSDQNFIDCIIYLLEKSFTGGNEEVKNVTESLFRFYQEPDFPFLLISIAENTNFSNSIRISAIIQITIIVKINYSNYNKEFWSHFLSKIKVIVSRSNYQIIPILKKLIRRVVDTLINMNWIDIAVDAMIKAINCGDFIFSMLIGRRIVVYFMKQDCEKYLPFMENYIDMLSKYNFDNSVLVYFMRFMSHIPPKVLIYLSQRNQNFVPFWISKIISNENLRTEIELLEYSILFLSNLSMFSENISIEALQFCFAIGKEKITQLSISYSLKTMYFILKNNLFIEVFINDFFNLINDIVLPLFNEIPIFEANNCWKNPLESSKNLVVLYLTKFPQLIKDFYAFILSQNDFKFVESMFLLSVITEYIVEIDKELFVSFLNEVMVYAESDNEYQRIAFFKVLSSLNISLDIKFSKLSFQHLNDTSSEVKYYAALSSAYLFNFLSTNEEKELIRESCTSFIPQIFHLFIKLENEIQDNYLGKAINNLIVFFKSQIIPISIELANELFLLFLNFSTSQRDPSSSLSIASALIKLIEISTADPNSCQSICNSLLNPLIDLSTKITYSPALDYLFQIFSKMILFIPTLTQSFWKLIDLCFVFVETRNTISFSDVSPIFINLIKREHSQSFLEELKENLLKYMQKQLEISNEYEWISITSIFLFLLQKLPNSLYYLSNIYQQTISLLNKTNDQNLYYPIIEFFIKNCFDKIDSEILPLFIDIFIKGSYSLSYIEVLIQTYDNFPDEYKQVLLEKSKIIISDYQENISEQDDEYNLFQQLLPKYQCFISNFS